MPRIDELPVPAQAQIRASRGELEPGAPAPEQKRMTLLQRLATVGFGARKEDAPAAPAEAAPTAPAAPAVAPAAEPRAAMSAVHAEYAKRPATPQGYRPAQGSLDAQGRIAVPQRSIEDEQLEIPAFLRRQAN
jgi:cell division protein FtsZ